MKSADVHQFCVIVENGYCSYVHAASLEEALVQFRKAVESSDELKKLKVDEVYDMSVGKTVFNRKTKI